MSRILALIVAAAAVACSDPGGPRDVYSQALFNSLGSYTVVPIGAPPGGGVVSFADVNDSSVVVGYVSIGGASYPFRWRNGVFQVLQSSGSFARASGVNNKGDVVGLNGVPVIWPAGSVQPVEIAPPESTTYRQGLAVDLSDDGKILFTLSFASGAAVVTRSPFARIGQMAHGTNPTINAAGLVALRLDENLYFPMFVWDAASNKTCSMGAHGTTTPIALNDHGEVLYSIVNTAGTYYSEYQVATYTPGAPCGGVTTVAEWKTGNALRSMNNRRIVAGLIDSAASVGIVGLRAFVTLDDVLKRSGGAAADWHVVDVLRVTNADVFVAMAQRAGTEPQLVLLVPVAH